MWKQELIDLHKKPVLGRGGFGMVYRINHEGRNAAVKKIDITTIKDYEIMKREIETLTKSRHRNIVQLYDYTEEANNAYLLMEYVNGGSLHKFLQSQTHILYTFAEGINWMLQAAEALAYVHSLKVIHRDVKPLNMLMTDDREIIKVCDFGAARFIKDGSYTQGQGTPVYMAPEVFSGRHYDEKCDSYSMGITIWHVLSRATPYASMNMGSMDLLTAVAKHGLRPDMSELRKECPQQLKDFIAKCWDHDPKKRPTMQEIVDFLRQQ